MTGSQASSDAAELRIGSGRVGDAGALACG